MGGLSGRRCYQPTWYVCNPTTAGAEEQAVWSFAPWGGIERSLAALPIPPLLLATPALPNGIGLRPPPSRRSRKADGREMRDEKGNREARIASAAKVFCPFGDLRAAALIQLLLVCASYEGRSRGLLKIRLRVPPAGRMKGMRHRWMRFEPYRPQAYLCTPEGIWRKARRIGRIPFMRPATPRALTRFFCLFVFLLPLCLSLMIFASFGRGSWGTRPLFLSFPSSNDRILPIR